MIPHDFMTLHAAKTVEYLIAVGYLLLFIPFWRFVNARPRQAEAVVPVRPLARRPIGDWFAVPANLLYHPGHSWVRVDGHQAATIGFTDFASKVVGPPEALRLPSPGSELRQGEPAWSVVVDGTPIDMLSPVDGTVAAVNERVLRSPELAHDRPYADGWLLKVESPRLATSLKQLLTGQVARRWLQDLADGLHGDFLPALGTVYQDGGVVVDGLAKAIDPEGWETVARRFFLTNGDGTSPQGGGHHA